jgi:hypothetical protein
MFAQGMSDGWRTESDAEPKIEDIVGMISHHTNTSFGIEVLRHRAHW